MTITLDTLELPDELIWDDEFEWSQITATVSRTVQGVAIIREKKYPTETGRSITLTSDNAWITRSDLLTLQEMSLDVDTIHTLTFHDGREFSVKFRYSDSPCIDASPLVEFAYNDDSEIQYSLELKLIVVEEG